MGVLPGLHCYWGGESVLIQKVDAGEYGSLTRCFGGGNEYGQS